MQANFKDISGVQILRNICTRLGCYLYSAEHSWVTIADIINNKIQLLVTHLNEQIATN